MRKNYVTWPEAREILGEENFHDLVGLQDMHPDLRLMPEEWNQFHLIPYSADVLDEHRKEVILYPEIKSDVKRNFITTKWFENNFPNIFSFNQKGVFDQYPHTLEVINAKLNSPMLQNRWRLIFKTLGDDSCTHKDKKTSFEISGMGMPNYIFAALLHYTKSREKLWIDDGRPIFCSELQLLVIVKSTSFRFVFS
ncbi:MAG: hypothetical protein AAB824_01215, partial [Patescibacteria group bacterium]